MNSCFDTVNFVRVRVRARALRLSMRRLLTVAAAVAAVFAVLLVTSRAEAIPVFARRYETSCQTCHIAFPRLTPFGEAFRRNGYRFPSGGDATSEKEEPIRLGAEAQKDVWPSGAVYPGQLPGRVPVAVAFEGTAAAGPEIEEGHAHDGGAHGGEAAEAAPKEHRGQMKFGDLGGAARILSGGTFGDIGSFFTSISFSNKEPAEVERAMVIFTPIDQTSLHIKVGKFEPSLHGVSIHRGLLGHQLRLTTGMAGMNGFMPEHALKGFEASGLIAGRLGWVAGYVENTVPVTGYTKDVYTRAEVKFGGMRLDGVDGKAGTAAWRERSLLVGGSAYRGRARVGAMEGMVMPDEHDDTFVRVGADLHVVFDDLIVDAVVLRQKHDSPMSKAADGPRTMDMLYGEVTYMTLPWLFPTVRLEASKLHGGGVPSPGTRWIGSLGINTVVRPNLTLRPQVAMGADPGDHSGFRYASLTAAAAF